MSQTLDAVQLLMEGSTRYSRAVTSFGLPLLFYVGSDGLVHTLSDPQQVDGRLTAAWSGGQAMVLSHRRMAEVVRLAQQAEEQLLQQPTAPAPTPVVERWTTTDYQETPEDEKRFARYEWEIDGFQLAEEQIRALKLILTTDRTVTILTGKAGAGKSAVVRWLEYNGLATISATTGRAAVNVGGVTVDSLFCLNRDKWEVFNWQLAEKYLRASHKLIVIDEASMIGQQMADLLLTVAEKFNKRLLLVGDWAQASPVKDSWGHGSRMFSGCNFIRLEECHRQSDPLFVRVLNSLRQGVVDQQVSDVLSQHVGRCPSEPGWVRMFATNNLATDYNRQRLQEHLQQTGNLPVRLFTTFQDCRSELQQKQRTRDSRYIASQVECLPFIHGDQLAIGAQVLFVHNHQRSEGREFVNGDVGELTDIRIRVEAPDAPDPKPVDPFLEDLDELLDKLLEPEEQESCRWLSQMTPEQQQEVRLRLDAGQGVVSLRVRLDRTEQEITVLPMTKEFKDPQGKLLHTLTGWPLRAGWAMTIHKSQGMTVDRAWLDMGSIRRMPTEGRHGLAYVGLSRVRSLEGLLISEWAPDVVWCSPEVQHLI